MYVKEKREKKNHRPSKYLFHNPSENTSSGEKEVNLFWFCLILRLFSLCISSFLILRVVYFIRVLFFCLILKGAGEGGKGFPKKKKM